MATLQTRPPQSPPPPRGKANEEIEPFVMPILLEQLQDELARSRKREAFWMSLFAHAVIIIAIWTSPKWIAWFPARTVEVKTPKELVQQQELTYLNAPPDTQRLTERPKTNTISDKDRIATSRRPQLDRKELNKILDSGRPGPPGPPVMPSPAVPPQMPQPQMQAGSRGQQSQPQNQQNSNSQAPVFPQASQQAKLQPGPNPFAAAAAMSPGAAVEQAARAAAASRGAGYGGAGGDYGVSTGGSGKIKSDLDILSDTMGVDFGPYLQRVLHDVRMNWYSLIPEAARAPLYKKGKVSIQFAITKDGSVAGLRISSQSGDVSLDRAALGGITGSNPFPPLPAEFRGNYLELRFHFFYNPDRNDLR